jgi:hypothetical protein
MLGRRLPGYSNSWPKSILATERSGVVPCREKKGQASATARWEPVDREGFRSQWELWFVGGRRQVSPNRKAVSGVISG